MKKSKNYSCSVVIMLVVANIIAEKFKSDIAEMSAIRADWDSEYADELKNRIKNAINNLVGIDNKKELREATILVQSITKKIKVTLNLLKLQIIKDFKTEPILQNEILINLGLTKNFKDYFKTQELLLKNVQIIKTNLNEDLITLLTSKGIHKELINSAISLANEFTDANCKQEMLKDESKEKYKSILDTYNAIYDDIIGICKIVKVNYPHNHPKREKYSFHKLVKKHSSISKANINTTVYTDTKNVNKDTKAAEDGSANI